ncbi:hypothetical protein TPS_02839 [Trichinella pseudospiralis]
MKPNNQNTRKSLVRATVDNCRPLNACMHTWVSSSSSSKPIICPMTTNRLASLVTVTGCQIAKFKHPLNEGN